MKGPKVSVIPSAVLAGQGGGGSRIFTVPNPPPAQGSSSGDASLSVEVPVGTVPANTGAPAVKSGDASLDCAVPVDLNSTLVSQKS
jgi:hypothetical protein